ncbi:hypothetical protein Salat_1701800 [Sesamum alatum]|uniref:Reverse transcriptase zinc-binding domain-containing protein n=1 Tax=Sesamum alatum TaxID=300844 RepID=A0AAE1Y7E0_9LAMI|nr:hypothetical protein Salat_1701800 [Sesamum alatum]
MAQPVTPPSTPPPQNIQADKASSSEGPRGFRGLRELYDVTEKVVRELELSRIASSSWTTPVVADDCHNFWSKLWAICAPQRVRLQVWKFCFRAVPVLENLARRRPGADAHCRLCGLKWSHCGMYCWSVLFARLVWAISNLPWRWVASWNNDTAVWISGVLQRLNQFDAARFLTICWALWQNRNKKVMEGTEQDPQRVVSEALLLLDQYQKARMKLQMGLL